MTILSIRGLSKRFGGLRAVDGVDLDVEAGEILGLIGPNGAGKTTFVDLLTGGQPPSAGSITFAGQDISGLSAHRRCSLGVARTFQVPKPFHDLSIRENVMIGALFGNREGRAALPEAHAQADEILERVGMGDTGDRPTGSLSTAGLKRLEVARCLAAKPRLLLLDEPLGGLNPTEANESLDLIRRLNASGVTIIFIEHIIPAVMAVSHRVVVLSGGRKLAEGSPAEIVADPAVQRAYLGDVHGAVDRYRNRRNRAAAGVLP